MSAKARYARSAAQEILSVPWKVRLADFWELSKPGIASLVLVAAATGYYVASVGSFDVLRFLMTIIGVGLVAASAGALNEYVERELDAKMKRTAHRPLPAGRVAAGQALAYGIALGVTGTALLILLVNVLTAALTASTLLLYIFAYTPMKRRSPLCTLVGAVPGAMPPLLGWVGSRGSIGVEGLVLFVILFFWQMPHFLSLAWMYRKDYGAAGFRMLSVDDSDGSQTARNILIHAAALLVVSLLPTFAGTVGHTYLVIAAVSGLAFLAFCVLFAVTKSPVHAKRLFLGSLLHLPVLLIVMVADKLL